MVLKGKCSEFGGPSDEGMSITEGLSIYEHHEADSRLDLFYHRGNNPNIGTSKRLRPESLYFAYRFPLDPRPDRKTLQKTQFLFRNPANGIYCVAWLADWGPHVDTGRVFDVSPGVATTLRVETDQLIEGIDVSELCTLFGC